MSSKRKERTDSESLESSDDESSTPNGGKVQSKDKRQKLQDVTLDKNAVTGVSTSTALPIQGVSADGFEYDRHQRRKMMKNDKKKLATTPLPTTPATTGPRKRFEFVQGKDECTSDQFCGVLRPPRVPQGFIFRCDPIRSTEDGVKNHLKSRGVSVTEVKQVSQPDSRFKSFKVSVEKLVDFNLLLSGSCIPKSCGVRKFIPPRSDRADNNTGFFRSWEASWDPPSSDVSAVLYKQNLEELNQLEANVVTISSTDSAAMDLTVDITNNHSTVSTGDSSVSEQQITLSNSNDTARKPNNVS